MRCKGFAFWIWQILQELLQGVAIFTEGLVDPIVEILEIVLHRSISLESVCHRIDNFTTAEERGSDHLIWHSAGRPLLQGVSQLLNGKNG